MIREKFLPLAKPYISDEEISCVLEVINSGWWTTGPKVSEFEDELCKYLQHEDPLYAVGLNSCTSALHLALLALNVKAGDEIIIPTWTFAATAQVVEWIGAKPIFCDIEGDSLNINIQMAETLINEKTKAIIPVHMAGYPCEMKAIGELAKKYHLKVIEDAAHAIGTKYNGVKIGNFSDVTCFSFYATKNLAMGEGGAAVSKDRDIIEKIRKIGYFGINKEAFKRYEKTGSWFYDIEEMGYKCNLDSIHAALGLAQLRKLDDLNIKRRRIAGMYKSKLNNIINFTRDNNEHFHIYHLFPIILPQRMDRDNFIIELRKRNIGSSVHFIPLHLHSNYRNRFTYDLFPIANELFKRIVSIPMFPSMADEDIIYVIHHINEIIGGYDG